MDKDKLFLQLKKSHDRLRWSGLSSDPDYVQFCHEYVESNAERIEKALKSISKLNEICDFLVEYRDECFSNVSDESLEQTQCFQQMIHGVLSHFCECIDIQFNFLLMSKNVLISQNHAERALIYRHIQVDLVRTFQRLHYIDEFIRKNGSLFSVELLRRECNNQKSELDKKYGIHKGALRDARNKTAAHWDEDVDYIDLFEKSKNVTEMQIHEICVDMFNLTQSYSSCLRDALNNYMTSVKESIYFAQTERK